MPSQHSTFFSIDPHPSKIGLQRLIPFAVTFTVLMFAYLNFLKSLPFQLAEFDAFQYLAFSKYVWSSGPLFMDPIRSPITTVFIPPNLLWARFVMVLCHIGAAILIYSLGRQLLNNTAAAIFAALAYGLSPWMLIFQTSPLTDLPALFLFLGGLWLWLKRSKRAVLFSGIVFGIAFLVRFDLLLFILPLFIWTPKGQKRYVLIPFLLVAGPIEFILDVLTYHRAVYTPWEFFRLNLATFGTSRESFFRENQLTLGRFATRDSLHVIKTLWRLFPYLVGLSFFGLFTLKRYGTQLLISLLIPFLFFISYVQPFEPRIFVVKILPLLALLAGNMFVVLNRASQPRLKQTIVCIALSILIGHATFASAKLRYIPWQFDTEDCRTGRLCSNFPSAIEYTCGVAATPITPTAVTLKSLPTRCDHFIYFKDVSGYSTIIDTSIKELFSPYEESSSAIIFSTHN